MTKIVKIFKTYVPTRNLGLSRGDVGFSLWNNHVPKEKEFKLPQRAT
jgi:hypothetical protein